MYIYTDLQTDYISFLGYRNKIPQAGWLKQLWRPAFQDQGATPFTCRGRLLSGSSHGFPSPCICVLISFFSKDISNTSLGPKLMALF